MTYEERKVHAGRYVLVEVTSTGGEAPVGEVYRMPYRNMSKSWRVVFTSPESIHFDRPIRNSKREAIQTLKRVHEKGHL